MNEQKVNIEEESNPPEGKSNDEALDILSKVDFVYVNASGVSGTNWDVRIALGDRLPSNKIEAKIGIVMSHTHAKAFLGVLQTVVKSIEDKLGHEIELIKESPSAGQK